MERESLRDAYGQKLADIGGKHKDLIVMDCDTSTSTKTNIFAKKFPERYMEMGIAEQSMVATAAGLALSGKKVFGSTFAIFLTRAYEQLRQSICYNNLDVKLVVSHAGLTVGEDGATHQIVEDVGIMSGLPNMRVIVPADSVETRSVVDFLAEKTTTPYYVRLSREKFPVVNSPDYEFEIGKSTVLKDGSDITLMTNGAMVGLTLEAADKLKEKGIDARVLNMSSMKPIDEHAIANAARETGKIVTTEEHSIYNGLGSRVAEVTSSQYPVLVRRVGMKDTFGKSGKGWELFDYFHMGVSDIVKEAESCFRDEKKYEDAQH